MKKLVNLGSVNELQIFSFVWPVKKCGKRKRDRIHSFFGKKHLQKMQKSVEISATYLKGTLTGLFENIFCKA